MSAKPEGLSFACEIVGGSIQNLSVGLGTRIRGGAPDLHDPRRNLAQRLEELNKELEADCLICGATFEAARPDRSDAVAIG